MRDLNYIGTMLKGIFLLFFLYLSHCSYLFPLNFSILVQSIERYTKLNKEILESERASEVELLVGIDVL